MTESSLQWSVKARIIELLAQEEQLLRVKIIKSCSNMASEPTIQYVLKNLVSTGLVDEFSEYREKSSSGGRPPKYYKLIVNSEKKDHCEDCFRKFWLDSETDERVPVILSRCVDCGKYICSNCNVDTRKGILCLGCVNNYFTCPSCGGDEILFPNNDGLLVCQNQECGAYLVPRDENAVSKLWGVMMNPNFHPEPQIKYTINIIPKKPLNNKLPCPYCKRWLPEEKFDKHVRNRHRRRWKRDNRKKIN